MSSSATSVVIYDATNQAWCHEADRAASLAAYKRSGRKWDGVCVKYGELKNCDHLIKRHDSHVGCGHFFAARTKFVHKRGGCRFDRCMHGASKGTVFCPLYGRHCDCLISHKKKAKKHCFLPYTASKFPSITTFIPSRGMSYEFLQIHECDWSGRISYLKEECEAVFDAMDDLDVTRDVGGVLVKDVISIIKGYVASLNFAQVVKSDKLYGDSMFKLAPYELQFAHHFDLSSLKVHEYEGSVQDASALFIECGESQHLLDASTVVIPPRRRVKISPRCGGGDYEVHSLGLSTEVVTCFQKLYIALASQEEMK